MKKWLRNIVKGASLTTALFIFQACYGTGPDMEIDMVVEGIVKAKSTGLPVKGIQVEIESNNMYDITDTNGHFTIYSSMSDGLNLLLSEYDTNTYEQTSLMDTNITDLSDSVYVEIILKDK